MSPTYKEMEKEMTKAKLKEIIIKISKLNKTELLAYHAEIYEVEPNIPVKAFGFIKKAFTLRMAENMDITDVSPMAVLSELKMGEI